MSESNIIQTTYPEICLAIDNCFASKRFTEPAEWMRLAGDLGLKYVEASADNECDPLYQGRDYLKRWVDQVKKASVATGVSVCNLYSGHGTYSTLGLAHPDPLVRDRMLNEWVKPMIDTAAELDAGLGFFCHAFPDQALQNPELYREFDTELCRNLAESSRYARKVGCRSIGLEQMYTPHQIPWTIGGARQLIQKVHELSGHPLYLTIDTGHQSGQRKFLKPTRETLLRILSEMRQTGRTGSVWLGPDSAYRMLDACIEQSGKTPEELADLMMAEMDLHPYLFASAEDSSHYAWLEHLGCFSPIIHLQQTDGTASRHLPFTDAHNRSGIIDGKRVLESIMKSYENTRDSLLPKVERIFLTIEVFAGTDSINYFTMADLRETVRYWRKFIPEDGISLDQLANRLHI